MRSSHSLDRLDVAFDDDRLVADAGLILPAPWPTGSVSGGSLTSTSISARRPAGERGRQGSDPHRLGPRRR